jgi:hypothetical protein
VTTLVCTRIATWSSELHRWPRGLLGAQAFVPEPERVHHAWAKVLDDHVGLSRGRAGAADIGRVAKIQDDPGLLQLTAWKYWALPDSS